MKKILLIITIICFWQNNFAQDRILWAGAKLYENYNYLLSANGKYIFKNVETMTSSGGYWNNWILQNQWTGEILYTSKGHDASITGAPALSLVKGGQFYAIPCYSNGQNLCQNRLFNGVSFYVPLLASSVDYFDSSNCTPQPCGTYRNAGPYDLIGIPSAYQSVENEVPIPTDNEVFQNNGGIFTVPSDKQAVAVVLLDDGNLIIVNASNEILWETGTSEQDMIEYKHNKRFRDLALNFESGIGLVSPGDVQIINTIIAQAETPCVLIATTFAQILPGTYLSSLNVTGSGYIELNSLGLAAPYNSRKADPKNPKTEVVLSPTSFTVYPNPTTGQVNFVTGQSDEQIQNITITDIVGRVISNNASLDKVDLSSNTTGIYLYKVETNKQTYSGKLIKK